MFENYSASVQKILKKINAKIGDRIKIIKAGKSYEGLLMPRCEIGDSNCIVIKLDSGYNISIIAERIKIQKSKMPEPKELEFELGKRKTFLIKKLKFDPAKPSVSLIATGGTIASRVDYKTGGVYMLMKPEEFLLNIPELHEIANFKKILNPLNKASEDMDYKDWQVIAKLAAKELNKGDNLIITHGTDTLHYTAAALSFMLKDLSKPVVLVGAQRSSDRGSADTAMNLICSTHAALSDIAEVGICMHGTMADDFCLFHKGVRVRKMHSTRRDAFWTINDTPLAKIWPDGKIEILNKSYKKRADTKVTADTKFEPKVALLKAYPNSEPEILNFLVSKGYKGFVIEGTGMGHVPTQAEKSWIPAIKKIIKDGVPVVIAPQTLFGRINTTVYRNLRILFHEAGAIPAADMLPEVAFIKLSWILGHTKDLEKIRKLMAENIAGEISARSLPTNFLV